MSHSAQVLDDAQRQVVVSEVDEMMDAMIEKASIPNLASLFRAGKEKGLIQPAYQYGHKS